MAQLPKQRKILVEDFPKQKDWLPKLLSPLNEFFEDVIRALNKGITFQENMAGSILTVNIDGVFPLDLKWSQTSRPVAAWIGQCKEIGKDHVVFTDPLFLDWEMKDSQTFRILGIPGLSASSTNRYKLTIMTVTG